MKPKAEKKITQLPCWRILKTRNGYVRVEEIIMHKGARAGTIWRKMGIWALKGGLLKKKSYPCNRP
jgi:hypothetical protein